MKSITNFVFGFLIKTLIVLNQWPQYGHYTHFNANTFASGNVFLLIGLRLILIKMTLHLML